MNDPVCYVVDGAVATIKLNRPRVGNALDLPLARSLLRAVHAADHDPAIRVLVLTGVGRLFCVGGDLSAFRAAGPDISGFLSELAGTLHAALSSLARMPKPFLVLVNGPAAGAGFGMALAGDLVLAASSAHFTAAYGAVGLSPDGGLTWWLPRLIGLRRAQEIVLSNRRVGADEAQAMGLVTQVVADAELEKAGRDAAQTLAAAATGAIATTRRLLLDSFESSLELHLEREACGVAARGAHAEAREGIAAFTEKRTPNFRGV